VCPSIAHISSRYYRFLSRFSTALNRSIPPSRIAKLLLGRPRTAKELADEMDFDADSVRRRLKVLTAERLLVKHGDRNARWCLGPASGRVLAGAAGGVWVNAMVVDLDGTPVPGTQVARRRKNRLRDAGAVAVELGTVMGEALNRLAPDEREHVTAVGIALPFGLRDDGRPASYVSNQASLHVPEYIYSAVRKMCPTAPRWAWPTQWAVTSDVAGEAVAEFHHGRLDQRAPRIPPVGVTLLMIVKAHREIRFALLSDGQGVDKGGVDLGHVRAALDGLAYGPESTTINTATEQALLRRFDPTHHRTCTVCKSGTQCLQMVVSPETVHELLLPPRSRTKNPGDRYQRRFDELVATPGADGATPSDQEMFERLFGSARHDEYGAGALLFRTIGRVLGRALDPIVTLHRPPVLLLTGFLARTEHFRRGVRDELSRHLGGNDSLTIITASGIRFETDDLPDATNPVDPVQTIAHQFWPTTGAARLALDRIALPETDRRFVAAAAGA
jgi:hypothetical protein